jgi:hypothetical protein
MREAAALLAQCIAHETAASQIALADYRRMREVGAKRRLLTRLLEDQP